MFDILRNIKEAGRGVTELDILENEIKEFKMSEERKLMMTGERYFEFDHDILKFKRKGIGEGGELEEIKNLPNCPIVDNQYGKLVLQKNNYLIGKPFSIQCENEDYTVLLSNIFNRRFHRTLKNVGEDSLNMGKGWLFCNYDANGHLSFKRLRANEVKPIWKDSDHTELEKAIRIYEMVHVDQNGKEEVIEKIEVYGINGIDYYECKDNKISPAEPFHTAYFRKINANGHVEDYNWDKIPLVCFKYNSKEIPLIKKAKPLQDAINLIETYFTNNMLEDSRSSIIVLVNYDGENLGEFRHNLATYGAVKVRSDGAGGGGDVKTLEVKVDSNNYKAILEILKKALIETCMGYDAKDDRMAGNPNQMNIQSMYSDIDLDANGTETEYQAAMEEVLEIVNNYLKFNGAEVPDAEVVITFNRDTMVSISEIVDNCIKSQGMLSQETILANHPWVKDPATEIDRIEKQKESEINPYLAIEGDGHEDEE